MLDVLCSYWLNFIRHYEIFKKPANSILTQELVAFGKDYFLIQAIGI
jgi:hypothetical protein